MRTSAQIVEIIEQFKNKELGLPHFKTYMKRIGNPQDKLSCIHIAGTNGKGSTVNYLRAMLQEAGYRVGTFTSPYLETHYDRIRINDENIDEESFANIANTYFDDWIKDDLNMFEIDMVIACLYFLQENCDICIFEVGLGGGKDATNIIQPLISSITNIGMDHMDRLGDTYEKIAMAKAGIIKDDIPVISGETKETCLDIFKQVCAQHHTRLYQVKKAHNIKYDMDHICFDYRHYHELCIQSGAHYQVENASLALEILHHLQQLNTFKVSDNDVKQGLQKALWKGRFETMHENPLIIIDGAHNVEGILALKQSLHTIPHVKILFAALKDKDTHDMIAHLLEVSDDVTVCEFDFYRVKPAKDIAEDFPVKIAKDYRDVIQASLASNTPLIITGSLYFISVVRNYLTT